MWAERRRRPTRHHIPAPDLADAPASLPEAVVDTTAGVLRVVAGVGVPALLSGSWLSVLVGIGALTPVSPRRP